MENHCRRVGKATSVRKKGYDFLQSRSVGHDAFRMENVNSYLLINDKNVSVDSHSAVRGL